MKKTLSVLFLLFALVIIAFSQNKSTSKPSRKLAIPKTTEAKTVGLVVEKYLSSYYINNDGTAKQIWEMQQSCLYETCIERVKSIKYVFNSGLQNIRLIEAYVIKPGGKKLDLAAVTGKSLPTPQAESAPGFSSLKQFEVDFDGFELGDSAYFKIEIETTKPIFGRHFDSMEHFPILFDWKSVEVNVNAPANYPLFFDATGLEGGQIGAEGGRTKWQWKKSDIKAIPVETAVYNPLDRSPRFAVTSFKSFDELAAAFWSGIKEKAVITPDIQTLADEITKDVKDPAAQAAAIYQWVNKNIRYLLVVVDRGGWVPHSSTEILQNRYGDCKDYTTLIYTLLRAKGIESTPVLINADLGNWFPAVAAMEYFNHAILYVPSVKLFADATSPNTRLGIIPQAIVGKTAVLAGERTGLIKVPENNPDDNQMLSEISVTVSDNGDLTAVSRNTYAGRSEIIFRPMLGGGAGGNADSFVKMLLAFYGISGSGRIISVSDPHTVGEPFVLSMEVTVPDFTTLTPKGTFSLPVGLNMFSIAALEMFTKEDKRNTDLIVGATRLREKYVIKFPAKAVFDDPPAPVNFSNDIGSFSLNYARVEGGIEMVRELVLKKDALTPSEYLLFKGMLKQAVEALNSSVTYTADPGLLKTKTARKAKQVVKQPQAHSMEALFSALLPKDEKKLTPSAVRRLEAKVASNPDDIETRTQLVRHYIRYDVKETPALIKARTAHRLWFIRNRPQADKFSVFGFTLREDSKDSVEYVTLRSEWLKQLAAQKSNKSVRLNIVDFARDAEPELAKQTLKDGIALDANAYEFPFELTKILIAEEKALASDAPAQKRTDLYKTILETGRSTLALLKKERSNKRDTDRGTLLMALCPVATKAGEIDLAESFARELVLDFGGEINNYRFEDAAHIGNTTLGRIALSRGNVSKAAEHMLISIRAPLRKTTGYFYDIDLVLAKELFKKGESKAVEEYLNLCLNLPAYKGDPDLYRNEIGALKKWLGEIGKKTEPSFDLDNP